MKIQLAFGQHGLDVTLPETANPTVIRKPEMPVADNGRSAVLHALSNPLGSEPLAQLASEAQSACILICDITRPVPNHLFLRPLIEQLISAGVPKSGIIVLVATGLHRPNLGDERWKSYWVIHG